MAATIKDVAKLAGTSPATVSKVMNGSYTISAKTADRVRQAMEELDYHPNVAARNFARQSSKLIVFLAALDENTGFSNPHMFEIVRGLESELSQKNYSLVVKTSSAAHICEYIEQAVNTKAADGFVIHASVISKELDEMIYLKQIPHLVIGMPHFTSHFCWIDIDNRLAGEMAARYLYERGYQALAFVGGEDRDEISRHRLEGVLSVLQRHDVILPHAHLRNGLSECDSAYQMTMEILKADRRPDAMICANNYIAYGCVSALHDARAQIGREIGVIAFDDYPFSQILKPRLTVIGIDVYDVGVQAGKQIIHKIRKPNLYIQSYITMPTLIERESTIKL